MSYEPSKHQFGLLACQLKDRHRFVQCVAPGTGPNITNIVLGDPRQAEDNRGHRARILCERDRSNML
jgi:hypothetical protein